MEYHLNSSFLTNSYSYGLSCGYDVAIVLSIWRDSMTRRERERHIRWTRREQAFVVVDLALCFFICVWTRPRILTVNELVGSLRQRRQMSVSPCLLPHCSLPFLFPNERTGRDSSNVIAIWSYVAVLSRLWIYCGYTYVSQRNNRGPGQDECWTLVERKKERRHIKQFHFHLWQQNTFSNHNHLAYILANLCSPPPARQQFLCGCCLRFAQYVSCYFLKWNWWLTYCDYFCCCCCKCSYIDSESTKIIT